MLLPAHLMKNEHLLSKQDKRTMLLKVYRRCPPLKSCIFLTYHVLLSLSLLPPTPSHTDKNSLIYFDLGNINIPQSYHCIFQG